MENNEYTLDMLWDDIQRIPEEAEDDSEVPGIRSREYESKLIIMQMLVGLAKEYSGDTYKDEEKLRLVLGGKVNGNELLSGFLFYISQNPQFDYSWSSMRKRIDSFVDFLTDSIRFLRNVIADTNVLAGKACPGKDLHLVFNDVIDVEKITESPHVFIVMRWENFHRMAAVKEDYHISVVSKENTVVAGNMKAADDVEKLIDQAIEMLNLQPKISE